MLFNFERSVALILPWCHLWWLVCLCVSTDKLIRLFLYQFLHKIGFKNIYFILNPRSGGIVHFDLIIWRIECLIWSSVWKWIFMIMKKLILIELHAAFVLDLFWILSVKIIWIISVIQTISGWLLKYHRLAEVLALDLWIVVDRWVHEC